MQRYDARTPQPPLPGRRRFTCALFGGTALALSGLRAPPVAAAMKSHACLYHGEALGRYGFPMGHPLGVDRQGAFLREAARQGLDARAIAKAPKVASREEVERFHTKAHVERVLNAERDGLEFLDNGDTPVFPGVFEASATVVGSALDGLHHVMRGECLRTFQPIGGLHHARRESSAGFCVFNDLGVVIETLRSEYGVRRIAYVDIDVHHGDGVYYPYEDDPDLIFADIHEDYRSLYPGTGRPDETGSGAAKGTKLNINLPSGAGDREFLAAWQDVVAHLRRFAPQFVLFQCGADGMDGDPLARLRYTPQVHAHAARSLVHLAGEFSAGRVMAFGGGGYDRDNLARAWCAVLRELLA